MAAIESCVGEGGGAEGVQFVVFAPVFSWGWGGGWPWLVDRPESALVLRVVANGEAVALGEGGGAGGEEEEEFVHILSIGRFKQNSSMDGLGRVRGADHGYFEHSWVCMFETKP